MAPATCLSQTPPPLLPSCPPIPRIAPVQPLSAPSLHPTRPGICPSPSLPAPSLRQIPPRPRPSPTPNTPLRLPPPRTCPLSPPTHLLVLAAALAVGVILLNQQRGRPVSRVGLAGHTRGRHHNASLAEGRAVQDTRSAETAVACTGGQAPGEGRQRKHAGHTVGQGDDPRRWGQGVGTGVDLACGAVMLLRACTCPCTPHPAPTPGNPTSTSHTWQPHTPHRNPKPNTPHLRQQRSG